MLFIDKLVDYEFDLVSVMSLNERKIKTEYFENRYPMYFYILSRTVNYHDKPFFLSFL
jgi:hypothetical protein